MATITINIADNKVDNIAKDLEVVIPRPEGIADIDYIKLVLKARLRDLRKAGRERKAIQGIAVDEDIT